MSIPPAARRDVMRWAEQLGFTPQMLLEDPESITAFIGACLERFPAFTHEHGREIFAWCREGAPTPGRSVAA